MGPSLHNAQVVDPATIVAPSGPSSKSDLLKHPSINGVNEERLPHVRENVTTDF